MNAVKFGTFLRSVRKEKNMTIVELAKKLSVSQPFISNLENGKKGIPKPDTLRKFSDALDIPYVVLMKEAGYVNNDGAVEVDSFRDMFPPSHGKGTITALNEQGQFEQAPVGAGGIPDYSKYNYLDIYDIVTKTDNVLYRKNELSEEDKEVLISILDGKFINEDNQDG